MKDAKSPDFITGTWNGLPNFECRVGPCAFASLDAKDMQAHLRQRHGIGVKVVPPAAPSPRRDRFDNIVEDPAPAPVAPIAGDKSAAQES